MEGLSVSGVRSADEDVKAAVRRRIQLSGYLSAYAAFFRAAEDGSVIDPGGDYLSDVVDLVHIETAPDHAHASLAGFRECDAGESSVGESEDLRVPVFKREHQIAASQA